MKSYDNLDKSLDKNIDKYYANEIDKTRAEEAELKSILDKMSIAEDLDNSVSVNVDISSIVENGQQIRFENKLRKETFKFLLFAAFLSVFIGFMYLRVSLYITFLVQFVAMIFLLILNQIVIKKKLRRDAR
jgi:hypothetical protein